MSGGTVERVARAMHRDNTERAARENTMRVPKAWAWENEPEELRESYRSNARTAILAMRDPSDRQIAAMREASETHGQRGHLRTQPISIGMCRTLAAAMIDAAVGDG